MRRIWFLLFTLLTFKTFAQSNQLYFEHLNVADGLPESFAKMVYQDKAGYIWIGTQNGLVRYDGYRMKIYKPGNDVKDSPKIFSFSGILEDENGAIWINGLRNTVYKYNRVGDSFKEYKFGSTYKTTTAKEKGVSDHHGHIWFYGGPEVLYGNAFSGLFQAAMLDTVTGKMTEYPWRSTSAVYTGNRVWLGTDKGLICYDPITGRLSAPVFPGLKLQVGRQVFITSLCAPDATPGVLWFSMFDDKMKSYGFFSYNIRKNTFNKYSCSPKTPGCIASDTVYDIKQDKLKRLWMGTYRGLSLYNARTGKFTNYTPPTVNRRDDSNPVTLIGSMADGKLWMGTTLSNIDAYGLLSFDPSNGAFCRYIHNDADPHSLYVNRISNIMTDRSGVLWIGMAWGGVDRINWLRSQFKSYQPIAGQADSYPTHGGAGLFQTNDGACWIGSSDGIVKWMPNTDVFSRVKVPAWLKGQHIAIEGLDRDGKLWCRSTSTRIFTYDTRTAVVDTLNIGGKWPESAGFNSFFQDHTGLIWLGTNGSGLYSYRKGDHSLNAYPHESNVIALSYHGKKLDNDRAYTIFEDRQKNLWIGTNSGFDRFNRDDGTFTSFSNTIKEFTVVISAAERDDGKFWLGSYTSGLFLFDPKTGPVRQYTREDGLLSDNVSKVLFDHHGRLWLFTDRGINLVAPGKKGFEALTTKNALSFTYTAATLVHAIETPQHEILAAFNEGLFAFYPDSLYKNTIAPQLQIESMEHEDPQSAKDSAGRVYLYGRNRIELPHDQNRLTFNYVALHYVSSAQNKYMYQLLGYDKTWSKAGTQRSVTYTNLSPGTYTFKVKAANSDGVWNEKGASVQIIIYPPWWGTWWAWVIYVLVFAGAVYAFIQYRSRKLLHDNKILEHKVQLRTEEVLQQKEEIEAQRDQLEHTIDQLRSTQTQLIQSEKMASLGELTAGIAHEIQNPLNFVNNFSEVSAEMIDELDEELDKGDVSEAKAIAGDIKQNLEKIRHHGKRADSIVKGMLEHSRASTGQKEPTDLNALADEYLRLAYHGLRAKDKSFNADLITDFDLNLPRVNIMGQEIGRVLLNLFNNAFYATGQKSKTAATDYKPQVTVTTRVNGEHVLVSVKDNGNGIPDAIKDKVMQPFFTTKPTGEGTGLGLSLSYDIVVKGHGGRIDVTTCEGDFTEFIVSLPLEK